MPDDRNRREILGGDLYVAPAPSPSHQRAVVNLTLRLGNYLGTRGSGGLYCSPIDVVLSDTDVVQPDLVFVSAGRMHIVTSTAIQGVPDLVIEVLSPSTERVDRGRKMQTYARAGVREYWIADSDARMVEIYSLQGETYRPIPHSAIFPDLTLDIGSLWD